MRKTLKFIIKLTVMSKIRDFCPNIIKNFIKLLLYKYKTWKRITYNNVKTLSISWILDNSTLLWNGNKIWKGSVIFSVQLGDYSYLWPQTQIISSKKYPVKIWKFCSIAWFTSFISAMWHDYNHRTTYKWDILNNLNIDDFPWEAIEIGNDVRIWQGAIILKGVKIWNWAIVWAWSIVTKDIPPIWNCMMKSC